MLESFGESGFVVGNCFGLGVEDGSVGEVRAGLSGEKGSNSVL